MYNNNLSAFRQSSLNSSEEFIVSNKYFNIDSGKDFESYEFRTYKNHVIVLDRFCKKLCIFNIQKNSKKSLYENQKIFSDFGYYSLTERFWKKSPFIALDQYLVFYTASQFIAFDYK